MDFLDSKVMKTIKLLFTLILALTITACSVDKVHEYPTSVTLDPESPTSQDTVKVSIKVYGQQKTTDAVLKYTVNGSKETTVPMEVNSKNITASIPAMKDGTKVNFTAVINSEDGHTTTVKKEYTVSEPGLIKTTSNLVWSWPMIILLLGTHIFLTIRLRVPQRKIFTAIKLSVKKDKNATGDVSQFSALATSLAATIGTGNIIGVATAVSLGGPGAVLWCWLTGVFGIATKYGEGLLAVKYRVKTSDGKMLGGPMYALERGLKMKWLAVLFCIFTAIAAFGIGNGVQANAISKNFTLLLSDNNSVVNFTLWLNNALGLNLNPEMYLSILVGICLMALVGVVIIGGVKSIGRICSALVPFMAILYVMGCIYILSVNHQYLWQAICWICRDAFSLKAGVGGAAGAAIMVGARYGIARGLFSNESGLGSAPIVAAAARTKNPVRQALVSSTGTFWDTVVVCAITGLVLTTSIIAYPEIDFHDGGLLTKKAFGMIPYVGTPILTFGILTFAFSTILGWSYYGERAMEYLGGKKIIKFYRIIWIIVCFMGCVMSLGVVWNIADIMNALMALPNLVALLLLSGVIAHETKRYLWSGKLDDQANDLI